MSTWNLVSFVVLTTLAAYSNVLVRADCPDGWVKHQESCHFFSHDRLSWTGAIFDYEKTQGCRDLKWSEPLDYRGWGPPSWNQVEWNARNVVCKLIGGYLAEVQDDSEKNFLDTTVDQRNEHYWIGAHDAVQEGSFVWATSRQPISVNHFVHSPDNYKNNEGCIEIDSDGNWNDNDCMTTFRYICERPASGQGEELIG